MTPTGRCWCCWLADYEGPIPVTDVALWHRVQLVPVNPTGSRPTHSNPRLSPVHSTSLALPPWLLLSRAPLALMATLCLVSLLRSSRCLLSKLRFDTSTIVSSLVPLPVSSVECFVIRSLFPSSFPRPTSKCYNALANRHSNNSLPFGPFLVLLGEMF